MPEISPHRSMADERTEEVTDIIEKMPTKFGTVVGLIAVVLTSLLLGLGWAIKYPETLAGQVTVTSGQPPVRLSSANPGRLQLLHANGDLIKADEYIAVLNNAALTNDVIRVDHLLKSIDVNSTDYKLRHFFPESVSLGEISSLYFTFLNNLYQFLDYDHEKLFNKQKDILTKLSASQQLSYTELNEEYKRLKSKYDLALKSYKRDSILFNGRVETEAEFEKSKMALINSEQDFKSVKIRISTNKYNIEDADNKSQQLIVQNMDKHRQLQVDLLNSYHELRESIKLWEHKYVFIAPIDGKIEYLNFWTNDSYVQTGQQVFSIMPKEKDFIGEMLLPEGGAGKVNVGQEVIVKLNGYPYQEYGSIYGKIKRISAITNEQNPVANSLQGGDGAAKVNTYLIMLEFPKGLKTNYGFKLNFRFEAKGTAEIVLNKRKLMERLFDHLKIAAN